MTATTRTESARIPSPSQLYADGKASGAPVDLNAANNWSHTWSGLAKKANKTDIKYTVDEVSVPADYTKTVSTNEAKNGICDHQYPCDRDNRSNGQEGMERQQ
ncbi:MAG: Cna B-type domain-containing protein [Blautia faecis]